MSHLYKQKAVFWLAYSVQGKLIRKSLKTKDRATARYMQSKHDQDRLEGKAPVLNAGALAVLDDFNKAYEHHKTHRTHIEDLARIRGFITWASIDKVSDINEKALQSYFNHRIEGDKLALNTVNRIMASLKTFLNFAVRRHYIPENPLKAIKKYRLPENTPRFLTKDEIARVLAQAKKTDLYPAVAAAIYTGMRRSELFHLEWSDVDLLQNRVTICNKEGFTTKSKKARVIPLHPTLCGILKAYRRAEGRCFDYTNQRRVFRRILRKAGLGKDVGWHSLRHTFASHLVMQGVDIVTVSKLLGHSTIATTMIYAHLTKEHERSAVEKLKF